MTFPGFSAEAALPATSTHHREALTPGAGAGTDSVTPQYCYTDSSGRTRCCTYVRYCGWICSHPILYI